MKPNPSLQNAALLLLRLTVATIFLFAGYMKWMLWSTPPETMGMSVGMWNLMKFLSIVEPLGAIGLVVGFLTRWAAAGLAIIMVGAIVLLSLTMNVAFFTMPQAPGWDYNLFILVTCITLIVFGGGQWSLDRAWRKI